ncbi:hypothetical protein C1645_840071 [Glomus cerebriforme]|uniref:Uncharacterized protein n=1 Tax=Glomus cerebriforme TaxID=658196 RepID=A0A397RZR1_9GLOM|nr:hypothetical protein C1645_840071 [Glomus cerebriforme]
MDKLILTNEKSQINQKCEYGKECTCQVREIEWKRRKAERDYTINFCHKPLTQKGITNQKVTLDKGFVDWLFANISSYINFSLLPNNINICQDCMNKYHNKNKENTDDDCIDLTNGSSPTPPASSILIPTPLIPSVLPVSTSQKRYIMLVCFDKFKQLRKKLDEAIDIPYCLDDLNTFGQIEEEILSRKLPTEWGKIELRFICYQKSTSTKADHYDLKSDGAIAAFRKQIVCGSSVIENDDAKESILKKIWI